MQKLSTPERPPEKVFTLILLVPKPQFGNEFSRDSVSSRPAK